MHNTRNMKSTTFAPTATMRLGAVKRAALMLLVMMLTTVGAWADNVNYIDQNGGRQTCSTYTEITASNKPTTLTAGWYVVTGSVSYTQTVSFSGDVHIILKDNAVMNVGTAQSPVSDRGFDRTNNAEFSVSIYAQSAGNSKGQLHVFGSVYGVYAYQGDITINGGLVEAVGNEAYGINTSGNIIINGGQVEATGGVRGIEGYKSVEINGGEVTATGSTYGIAAISGADSGSVIIRGGQVTATATDGPGIYGRHNITLGWTNPTDFIYASSYRFYDNLTIAEGKTFVDENGTTYNSGTVSASAINGKKLMAYSGGNWSDYKASAFSTINESAKTISITNEAELALLAYNTCSGTDYSDYTITLTRDLNMAAHTWDKSIGNSYDNTFRGTFNGGGHTISGIRISSGAYKGLFGYVGKSEKPGTIQNVTLASSTITGSRYVGGIVGYLQYGTVSNCHVLSSVSILASADNSIYFGGIVGQTYPNKRVSSAAIENCTSAATVTDNGKSGCSCFGGIVGYNYNYSDQYFSTVTGCFYYGTTVSASSSAGAIVGYAYVGNSASSNGISNCYYNYPSDITGIGSDSSESGTTRVCKVTCATTGLATTSNATYTHNGTRYYTANSTVTVSAPSLKIYALNVTEGSISNVSIAADRHSATFTIGSGDVTLALVFSGTTSDGLTWSLGGADYTELTISGTGYMKDYGYKTVDGIWKTDAPWSYDITSVTIGDNVYSIGKYAFIGCVNLASVTIGNNVVSIGQGAINHCDEMTEITLPHVNTIGGGAFENCQKLTTVNFGHEVAVTLATANAFNAPNLQYITFPNPDGAMANTATTGNWSGYRNKIRARFGNQLFTATNEGGTAAYAITNADDLRNLATAVNNGYNNYGVKFRVTSNITFAHTTNWNDANSQENNFVPIGDNHNGRTFNSEFDGGGYTISGIRIYKSGDGYQALFGFANVDANIHDVKLADTRITAYIYSGGIVGYNYGLISHCHVAATVAIHAVKSGSLFHGGIVGYNTGNRSVTFCTSAATLSNPNSDRNYGAIAGYNNGTLTDNLAIGATVNGADYYGAIVGFNNSGTLARNYYNACTLGGVANATGKGCNGADVTANDGAVPVFTLKLLDGVTTTATPTVSNDNINYYRGSIALSGMPSATAGWLYAYSVNGTAISGNSFTINADATVGISRTPDSAHFSQSGNEYTIHTSTGWNVFCDLLTDNAKGYFTGKTVKLGADNIKISRCAGTDAEPFTGTFNGNNMTLEFNGSATDNYTAPFRNTEGTSAAHAVIRDLKVKTTITSPDFRHAAGLVAVTNGDLDVSGCDVTVNISSTVGSNNPTNLYPAGLVSQVGSSSTLAVSDCTVGGTIATNGKYAAGYIGIIQGSASITNSISSVSIQSSISGDGTHGGFVGAQSNALTIEGCLFNGSIISTGTGTKATTSCGGFVGWKNGTVNISNSLFAPTSVNISDADSYTFSRRSATDISNCYYTEKLATAQGNAAHIYTPATDDFVPANVGAEGTTYDVSGITAYTTGLKRDGKFYLVKANVSLANDADNSAAIIDNQVADVTLTDRTLYKDGAWNTIVLPFDVTIAGSPLEGATARALSEASIEGSTLNLTFGDAVTTLAAGVPYIIKWNAAAQDIENPVFSGVTVVSTLHPVESADIDFLGSYAPVCVTATKGDNTLLYLGADNKLYWPNAPITIGAQRAVFRLKGGNTAGNPSNPQANISAINIDFGEGSVVTGIVSVSNESGNEVMTGAWFDLNGRRLSGKPTAKGLYIHNGRKVVIK